MLMQSVWDGTIGKIRHNGDMGRDEMSEKSGQIDHVSIVTRQDCRCRPRPFRNRTVCLVLGKEISRKSVCN
jgi:hypothetical protein